MVEAAQQSALSTEVLNEILGLRETTARLKREHQQAAEEVNSLRAHLDEGVERVRAAEAAQRQMAGSLQAAQDTIPMLQARVAKLEGDLRFLVDMFVPVHTKAQSLRPE